MWARWLFSENVRILFSISKYMFSETAKALFFFKLKLAKIMKKKLGAHVFCQNGWS